MIVHRMLKRYVLMNAFEEGGGGGAPEVSTPEVAAPEATAIETAEPKNMLEAMFGDKPAEPAPAVQGQPRDELGRFAGKTASEVSAIVAAEAAAGKPAAPAKPAEPQKPGEEDLQMPEGLKPESQQRFQKLANEVRELRPLKERAETLDRQVSYVRETFQTHGIKQEQFEQAADLIGMLNRGDYQGAQKALAEQMRVISMLSGQQVGAEALDPLQNFPDLRQAVDTLQITEPHALELAKGRFHQNTAQQYQERQQQQIQTRQQEEQLANRALSEVDAFCKQMQQSDLDYSVIEAQLLPEIQNLIAGVPPQRWKAVVEAQYRAIKNVAGRLKQSTPSTGTVLRPTGAGAPTVAPKSAYEAMWGKAPPSA